MAELIYFIAGLVAAFLFVYLKAKWDRFRGPFLWWLNRTVLKRPRKPIKIGTVTLTDVEEAKLQPVRIGDIFLPIRILEGGNGQVKYTYPNGIICEWNSKKLTLPEDIQNSYHRFLEKRIKDAEARGAVFEQRAHVRLDEHKIGLREGDDAPWPLRLIVSTTDYYTIQVTNYSIDEILPDGTTIREKYARDPGDLRGSVLGNPLAVNLSVVTADNKIYVAVRGRKAAVTPTGFAPAVSGTGNPFKDCNQEGIYSPFLTAQREAAEEITSRLPDLSEITFFGLARTLKFQLPFLFGEVRLSQTTAVELESSIPRDLWEAESLLALPFEIDIVLEFIRRIYSEMYEKDIINSATYAAIFSLIQSLRYEYPQEWGNIVKKLSVLKKIQQ